MVVLYRAEIEQLLRQRDASVQAWRDAHPHGDAFEDRGLEVTSGVSIDLDVTLVHIRSRLGLEG